MLSMSALRIDGNLRVIAGPATSDKEAMAFALNEVIGETTRVGTRFGRMMFDLVLSVSRVSKADSAVSASFSVRSKFNKYGST